MKQIFRVYDGKGKEVTGEKEWYIDINEGTLCFMTDDIDCPLREVDKSEYTYYCLSEKYGMNEVYKNNCLNINLKYFPSIPVITFESQLKYFATVSLTLAFKDSW